MKKNNINKELIDILAPKDHLRVAINLGNVILAQKNLVSGVLSGISVNLAKKFSNKINLHIEFIEYESANKVVESASLDKWDLAFLAIDPKREETIIFTEPYLIIEGAYLVRNDSDLYNINDVDQKNIKIAVGKNAAYDLYLSRNLKYAKTIKSSTTSEAVNLFLEKNIDVLAGIKDSLIDLSKKDNTLRVLDGSFMKIKQAMAIPLKSKEAKSIVDEFIKKNLCK